MKYSIIVRGRHHEWGVYVPEAQAKAMQEDGFEVSEVHNTIPAWVVDAGLIRPWCWAQDLWDLPSRLWRRITGEG